jgi:riboflavin synthase alpha subunit
MFTGLVEAVGELVSREPLPGGCRLGIASPFAGEVGLGDSVAVNGVCLTMIEVRDGIVFADVGPETERVTTLGDLAPGDLVNLERPLRAGDRLGGHFVQGHVDATGRVEAWREEAEFSWLTVSFPPALAPYFIEKGSVAVDGISLTVAALRGDRFDVQVVPFTTSHTNLRKVRVYDRVNLECDLIGKYVARAAELAARSLPSFTGTRER